MTEKMVFILVFIFTKAGTFKVMQEFQSWIFLYHKQKNIIIFKIK